MHELIKQLIEFDGAFRDIVKMCFNKDQMFEMDLKDALQDFVNKASYTSKLLP